MCGRGCVCVCVCACSGLLGCHRVCVFSVPSESALVTRSAPPTCLPPPMHALRQVILSLYGVAGHTWQDVTFEYSTWYQPNTNDGFVDLQVLHHSVCAGLCTGLCARGCVCAGMCACVLVCVYLLCWTSP